MPTTPTGTPSSNDDDAVIHMTLVGALGYSSAEWFCTPPSWADAQRGGPVFDGNAVGLRAVRGGVRVAAMRVLRHPMMVLSLIRAGIGLRSIAAFLLWIDSAQAFGLTTVVVRHERRKPLSLRIPTRSFPSRPPVTLALALIAQDEAARIEAMLNAALPLVDTGYVLDGGSADATIAIATRLGATVLQRPYTTELEQRNCLQAEIDCEWTLQLDADEVIQADLRELIRSSLTIAGFDCVYLPWLNLLDDDSVPFDFPLVIPRLFETRLRFRGRFHSRVHGYRRPLYFPASGPYVVHRKSRLQHYRNQLRYAELVPEWSSLSEAELDRLRAEVARLEDGSSAG